MGSEKPIVGLGTTLTKGRVVKISRDAVWLYTGSKTLPFSFSQIEKMALLTGRY
jgi:hypothetical protein